MAVEYERVAEVAVGQRVDARHVGNLSRSIGQRVLSGLGDAAWRMVYWWLAASRQIRNPDASQFNFPAMGEYLETYAHIRPDVQWPVTGPGDPEGTNLASILGAYVFGSAAADIEAEEVRLNDPSAGGVPVEIAQTPSEIWALGKRQRGVYDPDTGAVSAPAFQAAQEHYWLVQSPTSPHGNSYGGFFPTPEESGLACLDGDTDTPDSPNLILKFTNFQTGAVKEYEGTCPNYSGHVARVVNWPGGYYVILNNGQVDYLPRNEWIEGPYAGGNRLAKAYGEHMPRVLNRFVMDFRGGTAQYEAEQAGKRRPFSRSFPVPKFMASQYLLAPAFGRQMGPDSLAEVYPVILVSGVDHIARGARVGVPVEVPSGFVLAGVLIQTRHLARDVEISAHHGGTEIGRVTVSPGSPEAVWILPTPGRGKVEFRLPDGARFEPAGVLRIECALLWEYQPGAQDLMLICRLGGARGNLVENVDGSGLDEEDARELWASYARSGAIVRRRTDQFLPGSLTEINSNAVVEMFRRWSLEHVRVITRHQLVGYAVENGKSVLWIQPYAHGMARSLDADSLRGIRDEIRLKAPPKGWSNRWCLHVETQRYSNNETSVWKPSVLADWATLSDRCLHYTAGIPINDQLTTHFSPTSLGPKKLNFNPEVAPGYRYAKGVNNTASEEFYRSCRIYEPPLEIESAVTSIEDGAEVVKITLTGRLHHHHSLAPSSIVRDASGWDRGDLRDEAMSYRTPENALREYLVQAIDPTYQCEETGPGNAWSNSPILLGTDIPWGACYPRIFLCALPPEPYYDANSSRDDTDTVVSPDQLASMELWLRVISEGCVDGETTRKYGCETFIQAVYDYRWQNVCLEATGLPWIPTLPRDATSRLPARETRPDGPAGFGPLQGVAITAENFNRYAKITNLLNRYRVMLPAEFQARTMTGTKLFPTPGVIQSDGTPVICPGGSGLVNGFHWTGTPASVKADTEYIGWNPAPSGASSSIQIAFTELAGAYVCTGDDHGGFITRFDDEYRWWLTDPTASYAIPESWRDQLDSQGRLLCIQRDEIERIKAVAPGPIPTVCNGVIRWWTGADYVEWAVITDIREECVFVPAKGRVSVPPYKTTTFIGGNGSPICSELQASRADALRILVPMPTDALIFEVPLVDSPGTT